MSEGGRRRYIRVKSSVLQTTFTRKGTLYTESCPSPPPFPSTHTSFSNSLQPISPSQQRTYSLAPTELCSTCVASADAPAIPAPAPPTHPPHTPTSLPPPSTSPRSPGSPAHALPSHCPHPPPTQATRRPPPPRPRLCRCGSRRCRGALDAVVQGGGS